MRVRLQRMLHVHVADLPGRHREATSKDATCSFQEAYRCDLHTLSSKEAIDYKCKSIFITVSACNISSPGFVSYIESLLSDRLVIQMCIEALLVRIQGFVL